MLNSSTAEKKAFTGKKVPEAGESEWVRKKTSERKGRGGSEGRERSVRCSVVSGREGEKPSSLGGGRYDPRGNRRNIGMLSKVLGTGRNYERPNSKQQQVQGIRRILRISRRKGIRN